MKKLQRLELLKDFVQEAVDRGATSAESIHQYIADLPFEALEATGLLDRDRSALRKRQQRTIGMVYSAIRRINREIGKLLSEQFGTPDDRDDADDQFRLQPEPAGLPRRPAAAEKPTAKKPAARKPAPKKKVVTKPARKQAVAKKPAASKTAARKSARKPARKTAQRRKS